MSLRANVLFDGSLPLRLTCPTFFLCCSRSGDELESMQPSLYRNVARQLNISVAMESMVSDAFIGVATEILSTGTRRCLMGTSNRRQP